MSRRIVASPSGIFAMLLVPYLTASILNGTDTVLLNRRFDVEAFLPAVVSTQISTDYELETIKAQAIIARSNCYRRMNDKENFRELIEEISSKCRSYYFFKIPSEVYETAVSETEGRVLTWQNELKLVPYHEISAGKTRDGQEVFHDSEYSYLKSVDSSSDKDAPDYYNSSYVKMRQMPEKLTIENRDSSGYVMELAADGNIIEGEAFRQGLGLSSSNFTIQEVGDELRFLCKGKGHGLGFSQYGGNELAKSGSTDEEIVEVYFPEMIIQDINSVAFE